MKLKYVDALRGIAIMGVLVVHCGQHGSNDHLPSLVQSVVMNGARGVQLFYVASAFTLFLSLAGRRTLEARPWLNFYIRRFFRIAPMYYLAICYYLWQDGFGPRFWLGDAHQVTSWNIAANIFFVHGLNPYWITSVVPGGWSIAAEMLFYCLVPVLFLKIRNSREAFALVLGALLMRACLQFFLHRLSPIGSQALWMYYLNFYLPAQLPVFCLGILLYFIVKENYSVTVTPLLIVVLFFLCIGHLVGVRLLYDDFLFSIAFVLLAIALSRRAFPLFVNPLLVYLGKVSYSMYLVHFAVLYWMERSGVVDFIPASSPVNAILNFSIRLVILTGLSALASTLFYKVVELPFQAMGKKLIDRISRKARWTELPALDGTSPATVLSVRQDKTPRTAIDLSDGQ